MQRIVVIGLGAIQPLAAGVEAFWSGLLAGPSGIRRLPDDVAGDLPAGMASSSRSWRSETRRGRRRSAWKRPIRPETLVIDALRSDLSCFSLPDPTQRRI